MDSISSDSLFPAVPGLPPGTAFPWATSPWDNEEEDKAVFAHGRYRFNDQWELEAGVRYGEYDRDQFTLWFNDLFNPQGGPGAALNALARNLRDR